MGPGRLVDSGRPRRNDRWGKRYGTSAMDHPLAELVVNATTLYGAAGLLFAVAFAWRGWKSIDPHAEAGTIGFRLLIVPAAALLWPWLLVRWARRPSPRPEATNR